MFDNGDLMIQRFGVRFNFTGSSADKVPNRRGGFRQFALSSWQILRSIHPELRSSWKGQFTLHGDLQYATILGSDGLHVLDHGAFGSFADEDGV